MRRPHMTLSPLLQIYDHVLLDLDGCVWVEDQAVRRPLHGTAGRQAHPRAGGDRQPGCGPRRDRRGAAAAGDRDDRPLRFDAQRRDGPEDGRARGNRRRQRDRDGARAGECLEGPVAGDRRISGRRGRRGAGLDRVAAPGRAPQGGGRRGDRDGQRGHRRKQRGAGWKNREGQAFCPKGSDRKRRSNGSRDSRKRKNPAGYWAGAGAAAGLAPARGVSPSASACRRWACEYMYSSRVPG